MVTVHALKDVFDFHFESSNRAKIGLFVAGIVGHRLFLAHEFLHR